jgi:sortase A
MNRVKRGVPLIVVGIVLIFCSLVLVGYNFYQNYRGGVDAGNAVIELKSEIPANTPVYIQNPNMDMPVITIEGHDYIGMLDIESLDLELPVMSEWSYPNLAISPCRYSGSAYLANMVIAGHNYQSHFGKLHNLNVGDTVKFTDADGNLFTYSVASMEILTPEDVDSMENNDYDLTLFTCTVGAKTRLTIRCVATTTSTPTKQYGYSGVASY